MTKKVFENFANKYSNSGLRLCIESLNSHSKLFGEWGSIHSSNYIFDLQNELFTVTGNMSEFTKKLYSSDLYDSDFWISWKEKHCKTYTIHRKYLHTMYTITD